MPEPVSPVVPGLDLPEITFALNQHEYYPLPAYRTPEGVVVTRWRFTLRERIRLLFTGNLWLLVMTWNRALQPLTLDTSCPIAEPNRNQGAN